MNRIFGWIINGFLIAIIAFDIFSIWALYVFTSDLKYDFQFIFATLIIWNILSLIFFLIILIVSIAIKFHQKIGPISTVLISIGLLIIFILHILWYYSAVSSITSTLAVFAIFDPSNYF